MTGPSAPEAKSLRVMFLTLLFVAMGGMGLGFVSMFFLAYGRHYEWVSRGTSMMLVAFLAATGGLASTLVLQKGKLVWLMRAVILLLLTTMLWWSVFVWIVGDEPPGPQVARLARLGGTLAFAAFGLLSIERSVADQVRFIPSTWGPAAFPDRALAINRRDPFQILGLDPAALPTPEEAHEYVP